MKEATTRAKTPILFVLAALVPAGILILLAGANPLDAYWQIVVSAVGSRLSITETLARATPLILTGLAAAVAFRVRLWNIGASNRWYDEIFTAWAAVLPWGRMLAATAGEKDERTVTLELRDESERDVRIAAIPVRRGPAHLHRHGIRTAGSDADPRDDPARLAA